MTDPLGYRAYIPSAVSSGRQVIAERRVKPVESVESQDINRCLTCTIPVSRCKGAARCSLIETRGRKKNPCTGCNMSDICQRNSWTCWQKREYEREHNRAT